MKIIFITREGYNLSGARIRCYNFARELKKYGVDTEVFSFADILGAKYGEKEFEMSYFEKVKYNIKAFRMLLRKEKGSVFFMQRLNYHVPAPFLVSLLKGNKIIFDCDDWNMRENPVYHFGIYPTSKMEYFTRKLAGYSDICIAASSFLTDYLQGFNSKTFYIPTGVDTDLFKPQGNNGDSKITFSWIGTAYHEEMGENIRFILNCFSSLADRYDNISLDMAGEGAYFESIRNDIADFKHKERIKVRSWVSPDKIPDYLSGIDIGLLPLIQDTKFNRAKSPTKLFEYMAMSKPSVCSGIGESKEIIQEGQNGFLAKTQEEFIKKMEILIKNKELRHSMGVKAHATVEKKYSIKVLAKRLHEVLKTINA